jgi:hypothetical protein
VLDKEVRKNMDDEVPANVAVDVGMYVAHQRQTKKGDSTSLALILRRGSYIRSFPRRSSASALAAVKSSFRGDFGNCPSAT